MLAATRRARMLPDLLTAELLKQSASNLSDRGRPDKTSQSRFNGGIGEQGVSDKAMDVAKSVFEK